jgi:hypothetical protein
MLGVSCVSIDSPALAESQTKTVQVSATILPRLELTVTPETGSGIAFGEIEQPAFGATNDRTVKVKLGVFSNLGAPYHVTQMVRRPLENTQGLAIDDAQFTVSARDAGLGQVHTAGATPIVPGQTMTLYTSNAIGKSDQFLADYALQVTPTTPAGQFNTEIVYTVTSL